MGIKVEELKDEDVGNILSGLVSFKRECINLKDTSQSNDINCLIDKIKDNKIYVGENI